MSLTAERSSTVAGRTSTLVLITGPVYFSPQLRHGSDPSRGHVLQGRHGVRPAERERPQEFKVDVELDCDLSEPGKSDRIEDTVDYRQVRSIVKDVIEGESQKLLERLTSLIGDR